MKRQIPVVLMAAIFCQAQVSNEHGLDPRVDYQLLYQDTTKAGIPWDDRNMDLTLEDLGYLPPGDIEDTQKIPLFFRVYLRKLHPDIRTSGEGQYPRSAAEVFGLFWGGIMKDGLLEGERALGNIIVDGEIEITPGRKSAESAIAINPSQPNLVIAGVNGPAGQEMYYSDDAGLSWIRSTSNLGSTCCDPTVGWSTDGTIAYMAQLGTCSSLCNIEFFVSTDNGATWGSKQTLNLSSRNGTNDKEYLHVDNYPTSPYVGNIYMHWHSFNTITFARSTTNGSTWDPPIAFSGTTGIGGDIATDTLGKIYHVWPRTTGGSIRMNRSTDGGQTFDSIVQIADTNASFDYSLPCFDNRFAFIYTSVDVDLTSGPFMNQVYVCWNDTNGPESGVPANNHSKIVVAYSSDGGDNWTEVSPHSLVDINTVDRFNPWMEVDDNGWVHVVYYSTENDAARLKPDMYHTFSEDGGATWSTPLRITATSSNYISDGFQWGDYNGLSVEDGKIRPIWTDNRSNVRVYSADMTDDGPQGDFSILASNANRLICRAGEADPIVISLDSINGFSSAVSFDFDPALPTGVTGVFTENPATPPSSVTLEFSHDGSQPDGPIAVTVKALSGSIQHDFSFTLDLLNPDLTAYASLWRNDVLYESRFDLDSDMAISILDLTSYMECPQP